MPIGNSWGATNTRLSISPPHSKPAPTSPQSGKSFACLIAEKWRQRCGTISPTKPITPVSATRREVEKAQQRKISVRRRLTLMPRENAVRSPASSPSSSRHLSKQKASNSPRLAAQSPDYPSAPGPARPATRTVSSLPCAGHRRTPDNWSTPRTKRISPARR